MTRALVDACFVYALADGPSERGGRARAAAAAGGRRHAVRARRAARLDRRPRRRARRRAAPARPRPPPPRGRLAADPRRRPQRLRRAASAAASATYRVTGERLAGYAEAITAAGLDWDDGAGLRGRHELARGGDAVDARAARARPSPDRHPRHVRRARARRRRRRPRRRPVDVPGDLSVVGFDDAPAASPRGLTTVRQPLVEKGRTAGRMLLEAIAGAHARRRRAPDRARRPRLDR